MMKVLTLGNALVDHIVQLNDDLMLDNMKLPKGSMTLVDAVRSKDYREQLQHIQAMMASGGSAANTARGLANLGIHCGYIGMLGEDDTGRFFLSDLEKNGVRAHTLSGKVDSGVALTLITPDSERTFATYLGSAVELTAEDLDPAVFAEYDFLHMEGYLVQNHDLFTRALEIASDEGMLISLDLASYNVVEDNLRFLRDVLPGSVDILFANEAEARAYSGKDDLNAILEELGELFEQVVIKTGAEGCLISAYEEKYQVPAVKARVIDTNGAGDLFAAGYLAAHSFGRSPEECARLGALVAARVIEVTGTSISPETWKEIKGQSVEILQFSRDGR